jgi:RHS repeat-associated protein
MATYDFDAFGNPIERQLNGKPPATVLYGDGVYDPALAAYYAQIRCHDATAGRFTSPDICAGEATAPASLQRFGYAGETPIDAADPA